VSAAVLFSILLGTGIGGIPGKEGLLRALDVIADGLNVINKMIIKLTPIGVFAIAAGTSGTISLTEVDKLQAYLITYTLIALAMSFVVLPMLELCESNIGEPIRRQALSIRCRARAHPWTRSQCGEQRVFGSTYS